MAGEIGAAAIAAGVSLVVAAGTITVSYFSTRTAVKREHERQQAEFARMMTVKLYDRRVAVYPGLFAATGAFRRSKLNAAEDLPTHLRDAIDQVDEWHSRDGGLMLSGEAHQRLLDLRGSVRECIAANPTGRDRATYVNEIWGRKNRLREAMRADLGLLFDEDRPPPEQARSTLSGASPAVRMWRSG
ncbi:MAG TPA: hypothetical protein VFM27_21105 [Acidimicrobiales bacterium]|nr:hypothetical protein [Acidimicrobiales bacterium]